MASPVPNRILLFIVGLVLLVGAGMFALWPPRAGESAQPVGGRQEPIAGRGPARILLNEVVFQPASGEPQWVEILNAGGEPGMLDGLVLENHTGEKFPLPSPFTLQAGGVQVIRFPATFLAWPGSVQLTGAKGRVDRIAWGDGQAGAASLSRGGFEDAVVPGASLGRVPRTIASDPLEWVPFSPTQATPGRTNPQPGVEVLLPVDGAIVEGDVGDLTWYTVAGAARYRVQLAADRTFAAILLDQTVDMPPVKGPALAPGNYVWRVQVIDRDGGVTGYSQPSALTVAARGPAGRGRALLDALLPVLHAQGSPSPTIDQQLPTVLDVPLIKQHKDTRMLIIESRTESGAHAWDVDHGDLDVSDNADNMNCAPASVAMIAQYYKQRFGYPGRLSQDRINYEVFSADQPGPQGDLGGRPRGYNRARMTKALAFAFGVPPRVDPPVDDELLLAALWAARIGAGMPGIACKNRHCVAVVGFGGVSNLLVLNDPWRGTYLAPVRFLLDATVFVMARASSMFPQGPSAEPMLVRPASDEPEISRDSDGDGVVDFDEVRRFHTNPNLKDHDGDELPDKEDIEAGVHDRRYGFAYGGAGRDFDGDGKAMELDDDADDGGCLDGWEDANKNAKFDGGPGETDNFQRDDDSCLSGTFTNNSDLVKPPSGHQLRYEFQQRHTARFSIRRGADGALTGRGQVHFDEKVASGIITEQEGQPVECKYGMTVGPVDWTVELTAETTKLADGNIQVTLRPSPEKGPSFDSVATNRGPALCGPFSTTVTSQGHPWPMLGPYTLTNGMYRHVHSPPPPAGTTGTIVAEVVVKLKRGESR